MAKIAVFVNGGINSGFEDQGIPTLMSLINRLSHENKITIYSFTNANVSNSLNIKCVRENSLFHKLLLLLKFIWDHLRNNYELVQCFWGFPSGMVGAFLGKIIGVPSVVTLMGGETATLSEIQYGALREKKGIKRVSWLLKLATKTIVISQFQIKQIRSANLNDISDLILIPFGVDVQSKEPIKSPTAPFKLIHVGNINLVKDHQSLIEAFEIFLRKNKGVLTIVGGDFLQGKVHDLVKSKGLDDYVRFIGQVNNEKAIALMKISDLMIISSLSEGQSVVFSEAMSNSLPVCSTDVGLMHQLSGTHCLVSPIKKPEALANNIEQVLKKENLYLELVKNGREWTKYNNIETTVNSYREVYSKLLRNDNYKS